jgi:tetratricopeptide (TPR) repeat protein
MKNLMLVLFILSSLVGCGGETSDPDHVAKGWDAFTIGDLSKAYDQFSTAYLNDPEDSEAAHGFAWTLLKLDSLDRSLFFFDRADQLSVIQEADVLAGWSFALNAEKNYTESNAKAALALTADPNWEFTYGLGLNSVDLYLVQAENYFVLGNFTSSLAAVKSINASFSADITNATGRSQLAVEIERLRGLNKRLP